MDEFKREDSLDGMLARNQPPSTNASVEPESATLPILPARIIPLIFEPTKLFIALRQRPVFWGAIFFGALLVALSGFLTPTEVFEEAIRRQMAETGQEMPEGAAALAGFGRIAGTVGAFIALPIVTALWAGAFMVVFRFGMGYEGHYRQYLSVIAHAFLIVYVVTLLLTPLRIASSNPTLSLSFGTFLPMFEDGFLARFIHRLDLVTLWTFVLIGVGAAVVDGTRSIRTSVGVTLGVFVAFSLLLSLLPTPGP